MTAFGVLDLKSPGSITAPSTVGFTLGSATGAALRDFGLSDLIPVPSLKGVMFCDGIDFQYHAIDATSYVTGPLAPGVAPVATPSATRATLTLDFVAAQPDNDDSFSLASFSIGGTSMVVLFKSSLSATTTGSHLVEIKIGASLAATIANIEGFFNQSAAFTEGTHYHWRDPTTTATTVLAALKIKVSATTGTTVVFRVTVYGATGNSCFSTVLDSGGTPWTVGGSTVGALFTGGATGTGQQPAGGGSYIYDIARVRNGDHAQTAISPRVTVEQGSEGQIVVGTFGTPPTRDNETHTRTFRSTINGGEQFYKVGDTTGSSYTDTSSDATITGTGALLYDSSKFRPYEGGYPIRRRYGALYRGAVFLTGAVMEAKRSDGTATVTVGALAFTLASTKFKTDIIGRTLRFGSETNEYLVVDFTESSQAGLLSMAYAGALAGGGAAYTLTDERNPYGVEWCVPNKINQWPVGNSLEGVSSPDGSGSTGIEAAFDSLVMWTRTGLWQIQGDPFSTIPRFVPVCEGVGAYCGAAVVNADGLLYWLGPDGIWGWGGSGSPESISNPSNPSAGSPRGINDTVSRINADAVNLIVSDYNRTENVIRWWVPLDGSTWNSHVIVYDTQTGAFAVDTSPPVMCAASVVGADGDYHTLVGTAFGEVWELDLSTSDGAYGFDPIASFSSHSSITSTTTVVATLPTTGSGLAGVSVTKVSDVSWPPETVYVAANTATTFTPTTPFPTAPAAGDEFVFGAIPFRVQSGKCDFGLPEMPKRIASVVVSFTPQDSTTQGQLWCGASVDDAGPVLKALRSTGLPGWADLTDAKGRHLFVTNTAAGCRTQFELFALAPGFDVSVASWKCEIPVLTEVRT